MIRIYAAGWAATVALAVLGTAHAQDPKVQRGQRGTQGWRGPWGTTYASNLRINVHAMGEGDWVTYMKNLKARPPMPWWSVRETSEDDLRAMHAYIKQLGPGAETAVHPVSNASKVRREPK
ncbi:MAG TPA: hypothetical protein VF936_20615 [Burkholderiales bacterium]